MIGNCIARWVNLRVVLKDRTETALSQKQNLELLDEPVELIAAMGRVRVNLKSGWIDISWTVT